jgi:crotonobetainyl-CoA:carnitine CoA-transferase CaiB-like acyl-CoA transferase
VDSKPLQHIRVVEFGGYISGPYATSLLCALGADVVKIEKPGAGDDFRRHADDRSPYFIQYNAGKRSIGVDLKDPAGVALVRELIPHFDVLLENMRPGKMNAIGLGPDECRALRPDLIYTSVTGFGDGGPQADHPAYDTISQSFSGLYTLLGDEGHPQLTGTIFGDLVTGLSTAAGVLAALVARGITGQGSHVQTSLIEAVSTVTADALTQYYEDRHYNPSRESRHPQAQNFCLATASDHYIAIHMSSSQKFWHGLTRAINRRDLDEDPRFVDYNARVKNYFDLVPLVAEQIVTRPLAEWMVILRENDVPFSPVHTMDDFVHHPQVEWLELIEPETNGVSLLRPPWRFGGKRPQRETRAPRVGEHTRAIAQEVLGADRIEELVSSGVLSVAKGPVSTTPLATSRSKT